MSHHAATPEVGIRRRFDRPFRNPRFAPEPLERKLSPSATTAVATRVYIPITVMDTQTNPAPPRGRRRHAR